MDYYKKKSNGSYQMVEPPTVTNDTKKLTAELAVVKKDFEDCKELLIKYKKAMIECCTEFQKVAKKMKLKQAGNPKDMINFYLNKV